MKWDTEIIVDYNNSAIVTQSNPSDESKVSISTGGRYVYLNHDQVLELIGNLVALLADLEPEE